MAKKKYDRPTEVLAAGLQEVNHKFALAGMATKGLNTYTAYIEWDGEDFIEEIDVMAVNDKQAREVVAKALALDYLPDGKIKRLEQRFGIYF